MTLQSFGEELGVCVALQNLCLQELGRVLENLHRGKRARSPRTFLESLHGAWDPGWESNAVFGQLSDRRTGHQTPSKGWRVLSSDSYQQHGPFRHLTSTHASPGILGMGKRVETALGGNCV